MGVALSTLRSRARTRADMVKSRAVTDAELDVFINSAASELHDLIVQVNQDWRLSSDEITTTSGEDTYDLPEDFYLLRGVDLVTGSSPSDIVQLHRFEWEDRGKYTTDYPLVTARAAVEAFRYTIQGSLSIVFRPVPKAGQTVRLWYIPVMAALVEDDDELEGVNGWEEFVVVEAAIQMLQKVERDDRPLQVRKEMLRQRILRMATPRDMSEPQRMGGRTGEAEPWEDL